MISLTLRELEVLLLSLICLPMNVRTPDTDALTVKLSEIVAHEKMHRTLLKAQEKR